MSILKLGQINVSASINRANYYVALSLDTGSGFLTPYAAYNIEQLTSYFGEFPQKKLCEKLLERGILVLVLPVLSKVSWANKSTLRLYEKTKSEGDGTSRELLCYCHPRLEMEVLKPITDSSQLDNLVDSDIHKESTSFCLLLDFTNVTVDSNKDQYFIIPYLDESVERLLLFTFTSPEPIEKDYYCRKVYKETVTPSEIISAVEENASTYGYNVLNIGDYLQSLFNSYDGDIPEIIDGQDVQSNYSNYVEYLKEYLDYLSSIECYLDNWSEILDLVERLLTIDEPVGDQIYFTYNSEGKLPEEVSGKDIADSSTDFMSRLSYIVNQYSKMLLIQYKSIVHYCRTNQLDGLKTSYCSKYDERVLSTYSSNKALFEVYSRIKGPKANHIRIKIERYEYFDNSYIVRIISEELEELYYINTDLSVDIKTLGRDFQRIQEIDYNSQLVNLRVFDYILGNGTKIDKRFYDFGIDGNDEFVSYLEGGGTTGELQIIDLLPEGYDSCEIYLDGAVEEVETFYSRRNNIETFASYDYYPDFFLEDVFIRKDLWTGISDDELSDYLDKIYNYCQQRFSQCLANFDKDFLSRGSQFPQLGTSYKESRILKFYNTLILEGEKVCSFYPLILNFIDNDYLAVIADDIISKVTFNEDEFFAGNSILYNESKKKLIKAHLNFIDCDNLNYFYTNIREPFLDPSFILRFCVSKLSREVMINENLLINCPPNKIEYSINNIVSRVKSLLSLIQSLSYTYALDNHNLNIEFAMSLPKIVNQTYVFNITLNY